MPTPKLSVFAMALLPLMMAGWSRAETLTAPDLRFLQEAAEGGHMEVHMGQMAVKRGGNVAVKAFGQRLVQDHSTANSELRALAQKKGVKLPAHPAVEVPGSWMTLSGADFDRAFTKAAVEDHEKDIGAFEKQVKSGTDADIKAWAEKTLPTLRQHLESAKALREP